MGQTAKERADLGKALPLPKKGLQRIEFSGSIGAAEFFDIPRLAGTPARLLGGSSCFWGLLLHTSFENNARRIIARASRQPAVILLIRRESCRTRRDYWPRVPHWHYGRVTVAADLRMALVTSKRPGAPFESPHYGGLLTRLA
jgi:hypothetical protein